MKFSIPNLPVVIFVEFGDSIDGNEASTVFDENTAVIILHKLTDIEGDLLHELLHAVSHQLRRIGIEHTEATEEIYAYTLCYFYKIMLKKIKTHIEKTRYKLNKSSK